MDPASETYLEERRDRLLRSLSRVVSNPRILDAFRSVPRHLFVPAGLEAHAWEDRALPLIEGQTISQPTMIAMMLDALEPEPGRRALEIGSGCGYAAALLSHLVGEVHGIEIRPALAAVARECLARAGIKNVFIHVADGTRGLPEYSPYDCILVSAAATRVPRPLVEQLSPGGRIAIPVGDGGEQVLRVGVRPRTGGDVEWTTGVNCIFVPLLGTD